MKNEKINMAYVTKSVKGTYNYEKIVIKRIKKKKMRSLSLLWSTQKYKNIQIK